VGARALVDWLGMPADVVRDLPRIIVLGREEVVVSNHRGLLAYAPDHVSIRSSVGTVDVEGSRLRVAHVTADSVRVLGQVAAVRVLP